MLKKKVKNFQKWPRAAVKLGTNRHWYNPLQYSTGIINECMFYTTDRQGFEPRPKGPADLGGVQQDLEVPRPPRGLRRLRAGRCPEPRCSLVQPSFAIEDPFELLVAAMLAWLQTPN